MGHQAWALLLLFDIRLEVGDNSQRQGCYPSGHRGDLAEVPRLPGAAPMSGVVLMQRAVTLLIVETKQVHRWPCGPDGVQKTSSPRAATGVPVCLQPRPADVTR